LILISIEAPAVIFAPERSIKFDTDPPQRLDARFRLFKTDNLWNFLLLDTRLGLLYQIQYSVDTKKGSRGIFVLNDEPLVDPKDAKDARFTLYRTENMWNFLLLDQDDGRTWQCQFTVGDKGARGIIPLGGAIATKAGKSGPWTDFAPSRAVSVSPSPTP
jgi:hypothetical protein